MNITDLPALLWDGMMHTLHTATHPQTVAQGLWLPLLVIGAVALGAALSPRGVGFDESPFDGYTPRKAVTA